MQHRLTTLERAYELARSGRCRTIGDIKHALSSEGYERVADALYGRTLGAALRKLCHENYIPPPETAGAG